MKKIFRPRISRYVESLFMLLGILIPAYLYLEDIISLLLFRICLVGLLCLVISDLYKTWRHSLSIDADAIQGHVEGMDIKIYWQDTIAIKFIEPTNQPSFLLVGSRVEYVTISLKDFKDKQVWQAVEHYAPPSSLEEEAYKRLPDYDRWKDHHKNLISTHIPTLCVKISPWLRPILLFGIIVCLTMIMSFYSGFNGAFLCTSTFSILAVLYLAFNPSSIEADMYTIGKKTWLGQSKIRWDEITRMEVGRGSGKLIFYGENKRLVIPGFSDWGGPSVQDMCDYLSIQIAEREIETKATSWADYKWSKNVKVK